MRGAGWRRLAVVLAAVVGFAGSPLVGARGARGDCTSDRPSGHERHHARRFRSSSRSSTLSDHGPEAAIAAPRRHGHPRPVDRRRLRGDGAGVGRRRAGRAGGRQGRHLRRPDAAHRPARRSGRRRRVGTSQVGLPHRGAGRRHVAGRLHGLRRHRGGGRHRHRQRGRPGRTHRPRQERPQPAPASAALREPVGRADVRRQLRPRHVHRRHHRRQRRFVERRVEGHRPQRQRRLGQGRRARRLGRRQQRARRASSGSCRSRTATASRS